MGQAIGLRKAPIWRFSGAGSSTGQGRRARLRCTVRRTVSVVTPAAIKGQSEENGPLQCRERQVRYQAMIKAPGDLLDDREGSERKSQADEPAHEAATQGVALELLGDIAVLGAHQVKQLDDRGMRGQSHLGDQHRHENGRGRDQDDDAGGDQANPAGQVNQALQPLLVIDHQRVDRDVAYLLRQSLRVDFGARMQRYGNQPRQGEGESGFGRAKPGLHQVIDVGLVEQLGGDDLRLLFQDLQDRLDVDRLIVEGELRRG